MYYISTYIHRKVSFCKKKSRKERWKMLSVFSFSTIQIDFEDFIVYETEKSIVEETTITYNNNSI